MDHHVAVAADLPIATVLSAVNVLLEDPCQVWMAREVGQYFLALVTLKNPNRPVSEAAVRLHDEAVRNGLVEDLCRRSHGAKHWHADGGVDLSDVASLTGLVAEAPQDGGIIPV